MEDWRTWPFAPEQGTALCTLAEIPEKGAREVVFGEKIDQDRVSSSACNTRPNAPPIVDLTTPRGFVVVGVLS